MTNTQKTTAFSVATAFFAALVQSKAFGKYEPLAIALHSAFMIAWGVYTQGTAPKNSI